MTAAAVATLLDKGRLDLDALYRTRFLGHTFALRGMA